MVHIKERVPWNGRRSVRVFSRCIHRSLSSTLHRASPLGCTYTLTRVLGHLLFCRGVVVATRARSSPPHCVSQNWPSTCGGRVNREQERPLARRYARACLRNSTAVTCGKCDTMRRSQKTGGGSKGCVLPENCGASNRFLPPVNRKQSCRATQTILLSRAKQSTVSARPTHFSSSKRDAGDVVDIANCVT